MRAIPADERPFDHTPISLSDLPDTPTRDRNIAASAWTEAPETLLALGAKLAGSPEAAFKRRMVGWLLWRAGPSRGPCRYLAINPGDLEDCYFYELGSNEAEGGAGPDGQWHQRFRAWKESLRDSPPLPNVAE